MAQNEKTSQRVGSIAGKILDRLKECPRGEKYVTVGNVFGPVCTVAELRALAGSALTQVGDKPRKKVGRGKA